MSPLDDETRLRHMLDYSREAVAFVVGKTRVDLERGRLLQLGIVRLIHGYDFVDYDILSNTAHGKRKG